MKKMTLEVHGQEIEVIAQRVAGRLWLHYLGQTFVVEPKTLTNGGQSKNLGDPSLIVAPMPGKIIKLCKKPGETVAEGETVIIMEAMKMEYNLKAMMNGHVESVKVGEGETVPLGQKLVTLKEKT